MILKIRTGCVGEASEKMNNEGCNQHNICNALIHLKKLQDFIMDHSTPYFGNLLSRIVGADTIPFLLHTESGLLEVMGSHYNNCHGEKECFITSFFRVESIDEEKCCATISLLLPIDIHGKVTNSICDVMILRKTSTCRVIDLSCFCAIQALDTEFLKRKIIIEPKW